MAVINGTGGCGNLSPPATGDARDARAGGKGRFVFDNGFAHHTLIGCDKADFEDIDFSGVTAVACFFDMVNHRLEAPDGAGISANPKRR